MNIKDLRIGNLVKTCTPGQLIKVPGTIAEVQGASFGMVKFGKGPHVEAWEMHQNHVSGILITTNLLVSVGFTANVDMDGEPYMGMGSFKIEQFDYFHQNAEWMVVEMNGFQSEVKIEFLHQLQNLFFAVTGEEMAIPENFKTQLAP